MKKKLTAVLLTLCMVLGMLPLSAFAATYTATLEGSKNVIVDDTDGITVKDATTGEAVDSNTYYNFEIVDTDTLKYYYRGQSKTATLTEVTITIVGDNTITKEEGSQDVKLDAERTVKEDGKTVVKKFSKAALTASADATGDGGVTEIEVDEVTFDLDDETLTALAELLQGDEDLDIEVNPDVVEPTSDEVAAFTLEEGTATRPNAAKLTAIEINLVAISTRGSRDIGGLLTKAIPVKADFGVAPEEGEAGKIWSLKDVDGVKTLGLMADVDEVENEGTVWSWTAKHFSTVMVEITDGSDTDETRDAVITVDDVTNYFKVTFNSDVEAGDWFLWDVKLENGSHTANCGKIQDVENILIGRPSEGCTVAAWATKAENQPLWVEGLLDVEGVVSWNYTEGWMD